LEGFTSPVFEFIQNSAVNARSYFATGRLGQLAYNYFGGSIGEPIWKDKVFFFASDVYILICRTLSISVPP